MPAEGTHRQAIPKATLLMPTTSALVQTHLTSHLDCYSHLPTTCPHTVPGQSFPLSDSWGKDTHSTFTGIVISICTVQSYSCIMSKPKPSPPDCPLPNYKLESWNAQRGQLFQLGRKDCYLKKCPLNGHYNTDEDTELPGANTLDTLTTAAMMATPGLGPKKSRRVQGTLSHPGPEWPHPPRNHVCPHSSPEPALPPTCPSSATWHCHQHITEPILQASAE